MNLKLENQKIKITFKLKNQSIFISMENTYVKFQNNNKYEIVLGKNKEFHIIANIEDYLYSEPEVFLNNEKKEFELLIKCQVLIEDIEIINHPLNVPVNSKEIYTLNGIALGSGINEEDTLRVTSNQRQYRSSILKNGFFSVNILKSDMILDNTLLLKIYNNKKEETCSKTVVFRLTEPKKKNYSYYFSFDIKKALNAEVFLFKSYINQFGENSNVDEKTINYFNYRNTIDGNINYIISLYINEYYDNIPDFVKLIAKTSGYAIGSIPSTKELRKIIDTKTRVQDSIKLDIELWEKLTKFLEKLREATGVNYTRHTITNIFFNDYYQTYRFAIKDEIINLYDNYFYNSATFNCRIDDNKFLTIAEKLEYITPKRNIKG